MLGSVNARSVVSRYRVLRWLAPVGVFALAGGIAAAVTTGGSLPRRASVPSPASLIAAVRTAQVAGFSGTVVSTLSLGVPALPAVADLDDGSPLTSLPSGSHTMQVWYGGPTRQRVAVLGATEETDVFRDGRSLWQWTSSDRTAVHATLPAGRTRTPALTQDGALASLTPPQLARGALSRVGAGTELRVTAQRPIADRSVYDLVLTPRAADTLVGSVRISVDAATKTPLAVRVFARGAAVPAVDVSFASITFAAPVARNFRFTPPSGARIRTVGMSRLAGARRGAAPARSPAGCPSACVDSAGRVGVGWLRVRAVQTSGGLSSEVRALLASATEVRGSWGSGRLLCTPLVDVLVTDDGRVFSGPVTPAALFAAAATK